MKRGATTPADAPIVTPTRRGPMSIESPCISLCAIDPRSGYCFGCGRTGEEIGAWIAFSPEQRRAVMDTLPARMATIERPARRGTKRRRLERERTEAQGADDA